MELINFFQWVNKKINSLTIPIPIITIHGVIIFCLLFFRHLGGFQPLELVVFDWMMCLGPYEEPDPRLLIVEITEKDIKALKQWPIYDEILATVLVSLQRYQPKAIGLDVFQDIHTDTSSLAVPSESSENLSSQCDSRRINIGGISQCSEEYP